MSVYRKESNSLVPKAGLGIIDNILNLFSNHAISNRAVALKFGEVDEKIANDVVGFPDYSNRTAISSGYTCDENGWIQAVKDGHYLTDPSKVYINGVAIFVFMVDRNTQDIYKAITELVGPVKKGDVITFSNMSTVYFMPFR